MACSSCCCDALFAVSLFRSRTNLIIGNGESMCATLAASQRCCFATQLLMIARCCLCAVVAGMLLIMYSREYYAHQPSHGSAAGLDFEYSKQSWLPYSWQPFVRSNHHMALANATMRG